jgi:hypothetical protein
MDAEQFDIATVAGLVPPRRLGLLLLGLRQARGDSLERAAASTEGRISTDRLLALETGEAIATPGELGYLAKVYSFPLTELVPQRVRLVLDYDERLIDAGGFCAVVPEGQTVTEVLQRYLLLVWALRGRQPGSFLYFRELDVSVLADGFGLGSDGVTGLLGELLDDSTWVAPWSHPSQFGRPRFSPLVPGAGILLCAGAQGALIFKPDTDPAPAPSPGTFRYEASDAPVPSWARGIDPVEADEATSANDHTIDHTDAGADESHDIDRGTNDRVDLDRVDLDRVDLDRVDLDRVDLDRGQADAVDHVDTESPIHEVDALHGEPIEARLPSAVEQWPIDHSEPAVDSSGVSDLYPSAYSTPVTPSFSSSYDTPIDVAPADYTFREYETPVYEPQSFEPQSYEPQSYEPQPSDDASPLSHTVGAVEPSSLGTSDDAWGIESLRAVFVEADAEFIAQRDDRVVEAAPAVDEWSSLRSAFEQTSPAAHLPIEQAPETIVVNEWDVLASHQPLAQPFTQPLPDTQAGPTWTFEGEEHHDSFDASALIAPQHHEPTVHYVSSEWELAETTDDTVSFAPTAEIGRVEPPAADHAPATAPSAWERFTKSAEGRTDSPAAHSGDLPYWSFDASDFQPSPPPAAVTASEAEGYSLPTRPDDVMPGVPGVPSDLLSAFDLNDEWNSPEAAADPWTVAVQDRSAGARQISDLPYATSGPTAPGPDLSGEQDSDRRGDKRSERPGRAERRGSESTTWPQMTADLPTDALALPETDAAPWDEAGPKRLRKIFPGKR